METFAIFMRKRFGEKYAFVKELVGREEEAVRTSLDCYNKNKANGAMVLDGDMKKVFEVNRKCRCLNVQYEIDGRMICMDCKLVHREAQEQEAVEDGARV